jgi:uncharacterized protein (TIGR00251 family)
MKVVMNLDKWIKDGKFRVKVIPNSSKLELVEDGEGLKLYLKAVPDKNKANRELVKFFKKRYDLKVEIVSGIRSRMKILRVY